MVPNYIINCIFMRLLPRSKGNILALEFKNEVTQRDRKGSDRFMEDTKIGVRIKLSALWVFVMVNMVFADILSFIRPGFFEEIAKQQINDVMLAVFAVLIVIPASMIFLSLVLKKKANSRANIVVAVITTLWIIGGGSAYPHYIIFASMEVLAMLLIVRYAWNWSKEEASLPSS